MRKLKKVSPLILIIAFSLFFLIPKINKKLVGYHDWNSVVYSSSARSLIGKAETGEIFYQQDYPPLVPFALSLSFLIFGIKEWSVRLVPIVFTFLTSLMIYFLARKLWGKKEGLIASVLYLNTPLIRYFGKIPVHETITPFFVLLVFYTYWLWFKEQSLRKYLLLLVSIFLAEQSGWAGFYPIPLITLHYLFFSKRKKLGSVINWWLLSLLSFIFFMAFDFWIIGRLPLKDLWQIFLTRASFEKESPFNFSWFDFLKKELLWIRIYLTRVLSFFVIIWFLTSLFSSKKKKIAARNSLLIFLGIFGLVHLLLFRQLAWLHDYMIIYLFPFLVIIVAKALLFIAKKMKLNYRLLLILIVFLMYFESRNFIKALENNLDSYPGYKLGVFVHSLTEPQEKVFIGCKEASKIYGVYFYFYANRNYSAGEPSLEEFLEEEKIYQKNFRLFVVDWSHNRLSPELINYLENNYSSRKITPFELFDLRNKFTLKRSFFYGT